MLTKKNNVAGITLPWALLLLLIFSCRQSDRMQTGSVPAVAEDEFSKHIRTTEARTPAEEQAGFTLPPGFEIQLFASEPEIAKPLNMAFDARGRMWLTQSYEYPFADTTGAGKDKISILEDTDGDGRADRITTFADSLNIPIGIVAVPNGAIAYSIPGIYHFIDRDGDDRVDERQLLYSGFRYEDTHGMVNNFMRSWDGWIHADHGFANTSKVAGTDGDTIVMFSGNTFRFRADGSRIEFTTTGRVNPYGYAYDELGYTYSSDCHTSPIYQLVRGADYPHFGKKPTGIGFGPALMDHNYGSTALAGLEYYLADQYPEAYQRSFYLGDVVKSRVYRSTMVMRGTTPEISWQPDFVISADPWFRPVDVKLGPDGALYIADFYNRIIGHYEVPLDHPGRDRQRGRIWRIVYRGEAAPVKDWTKAGLQELIEGLDHPNLPLRMSLADQITDRFGSKAVEAVTSMLAEDQSSSRQRVQGLWILYRLQALPPALLAGAAADSDDTVRIHAFRIMYELDDMDERFLKLAREALGDANPHIQRQVTMVLARNPASDQIKPLLALRSSVAQEDSHFFYAVRQALRDHLRAPHILQWVQAQKWNEPDARALADVMVGVNSENAARFLITHLDNFAVPGAQLLKQAQHAARFSKPQELGRLITILQKRSEGDRDLEFLLFKTVQEGLDQAGRSLNDQGKAWGIALAADFLGRQPASARQWKLLPHDHFPYQSNPWVVTDTTVQGVSTPVRILASGPMNGTGAVAGSMYSPTFNLPESLSFYLFGQKNQAGENETPTPPGNWVELRLADDHVPVARAEIRAGQAMEKINWSLDENTGKLAYLVVNDGSRTWGEYIAVGAFAPAVVQLPADSPKQNAERQLFACQIAKDHQVKEFRAALEQLLGNDHTDTYVRAAAAEALLTIDQKATLQVIKTLLQKGSEPQLLKDRLALLIGGMDSPDARQVLAGTLADFRYEVQKEIALALTTTPAGINTLLAAVEKGYVAPRLLMERQVQERLLPAMRASQKELWTQLTSDVPAPNEQIQELIDSRLAGYRMQRYTPQNGAPVFRQYCVTCHQLNGEGSTIGPQLDGIGNWGLQALTEKILDPNRNISKAFKNYTIKLKNGETRSGLYRREEGQQLVFANAAGDEFNIDKDAVAEQKLSPYTLMPDHFGTVIPEQDYYALMAFLLNEK